MEFAIGGIAAASAGFFTNPLEVLKIRMQLQGELKAKGQHVIHYKNVFHAAYAVAANDGILALQKGLVPALWVQLIMNGMRFGCYDFGQSRGFVTNANGEVVFYKSALVSGIGGVIGQFLASPFYMVKTHLQAQAVEAIAVGHQHDHGKMTDAFRTIFKTQGFKGLFRGATASIPRAFIASTSQLTSFHFCKQWLQKHSNLNERKLLTSFLASMVGGICISVMVTPFDLILTRLYNQPVEKNGKGKHYNNYVDCVTKIYKTEGISAFYKGVGAIYFRLGPHTVLCLVFWDVFKDLFDKMVKNQL